jgi:DNA polymerase-1
MKASKLRESLIEQADMARLSRQLVALKEDCPLPVPLEDFALGPIPPEPLAAFLTTHGFTSLLRKLGRRPSPAGRRRAQARGEQIVAPRFARPGQHAPGAADLAGDRPRCLSLRADDGGSCRTGSRAPGGADRGDRHRNLRARFDARRSGGREPGDRRGRGLLFRSAIAASTCSPKPLADPREQALAALKPLLESDAVLKVGQNIKYDLTVLARHGIAVAPIDDTMVMSFCLDAGRGEVGLTGHGMDELASRHLSHDDPVQGRVRHRQEADLVRASAAGRCHALCRRGRRGDLAPAPAVRPAPVGRGRHARPGGVDRPLVPVVAGMERAGIRVEREQLATLSTPLPPRFRDSRRDPRKAGGPFLIGSPKQLGDVLFDKLGYKGGKKGKSGQYSTDQSVLETLAGQGAEVATLVLEWRQLSKLKSTYTDALQAAINPDTGRVTPATALSARKPGGFRRTIPTQNIPIRTEIGRQIREAFVAAPGHPC